MDSVLRAATTAGTYAASIVILCLTIALAWFIAWKLILHQIPFFRDVLGFAGFGTPKNKPDNRTKRKPSKGNDIRNRDKSSVSRVDRGTSSISRASIERTKEALADVDEKPDKARADGRRVSFGGIDS